jgi:hypothetical protein
MGAEAGMATLAQFVHRPCWRAVLIFSTVTALAGCAQRNPTGPSPHPTPRVLALAPVLNLSGSQDFDPLKLTDLIASEFLSFEGFAVVPVNLTLAELERRGKRAVETPEDAIALASALGADATVVVAVTEYNPYYPPVVGLIMQWYSAKPDDGPVSFGTEASPNAGTVAVELSDHRNFGPCRQIQRVFNAADEKTLSEVRAYAAKREGHDSPYAWRKYVQSQELYVRYCTWELILTTERLEASDRTAVQPNEAKL